jgi:hypothetical protein
MPSTCCGLNPKRTAICSAATQSGANLRNRPRGMSERTAGTVQRAQRKRDRGDALRTMRDGNVVETIE